jgi:cell division protease FtsH
LNRVVKNLGIYIIIFALVLGVAWVYQGNQGQQVTEVEFSEFVTSVQKREVKELTIIDTSLVGTLKSGDKISTYAPYIH